MANVLLELAADMDSSWSMVCAHPSAQITPIFWRECVLLINARKVTIPMVTEGVSGPGSMNVKKASTTIKATVLPSALPHFMLIPLASNVSTAPQTAIPASTPFSALLVLEITQILMEFAI